VLAGVATNREILEDLSLDDVDLWNLLLDEMDATRPSKE
jgi:hypothetical protein